MQNAVVNIILLFFSNFDRGLQKAPLHTQPTYFTLFRNRRLILDEIT